MKLGISGDIMKINDTGELRNDLVRHYSRIRDFFAAARIARITAAWLFLSGLCSAASITFTLQGTATGTLVNNSATTSFSNAPYSFSVVTDTSLITTSGSNPPGGTFYYTPFVSGTTGGSVTIDGVMGTWANGVGIYNFIYPSVDPTNESISFTEQVSDGSFFFTFGSDTSLFNYELQSAIGPLTLASLSVNFPEAVTTSFGSFTLTSISSEKFTATVTPAPCTLKDSASYDATSSTLTMNFIVGNNEKSAVTWNAWLTYQNTMESLFSVLQPITNPAASITKTTTLAPEGTVGVLSTLTTADGGIVCSSFVAAKTATP
jgi:hypothetical protein